MIEILIPNNFNSEITYIINVLFNDFLGIETNITTSDTKDYLIKFDNKELIINNEFFGKFNNGLDYLEKENIPSSVNFTNNQFTIEEDIPILFGNNELKVEENSIYCGIDIFASSFFMLTRWEENVCEEKDEHGRFPSSKSLIQKSELQYRPIVNEYLEMLWNMLTSLGYNGERKPRDYNIKATHDIDWFYKYRKFNKYIRALGGDIVKRKNPLLLFKTTYEYLFSKLGLIKDPYNTFEKLMDISNQKEVKSTFFFMASYLDKYDVCYDITDNKVSKIIKNIKEKGHKIALHGTYNSFDSKEVLKEELENLQSITGNTTENRQHFLRFKNPDTWQMYEDLGLTTDNNVGFENDIGFRAGVCYSYPVFNILSRKQLNLRTSPFLIMDSIFIYNKDYSKTQFIEKCKIISDKVKKYNGTMHIIWHNNSHVNFYRDNIINLL